MLANTKTLSTHNHNLFQQLERTVSQYPIPIPQLEALILQLLPDADSDPALITSRTETLFNTLLMTLLTFQIDKSQPDWQRKCGLPEQRLAALKQLLQAVCGGPASQVLKRSVVISFIQNVLECLGVCDLTEVLNVISSQIPRFASGLQESDQLKLLRVINLLLKRVSKTQDYHLRGQLHLALTRFLPICHDSGFHFRANPAKTNACEKISSSDPAPEPPAPGLTYQFYQQFWELQRWFMEPNQVAGEGISARLKKIDQTLKEVLQYFDNHPAKDNTDYYNQPLKFLKNYSLLALQLADPFFRKLIMMQTLFFTHAITHPLSKSPIALTQADKKTILDIEAIPKRFLGQYGEEGKQFLSQVQRVLVGEQGWAELKEQWKDKKKNFTKRVQETGEQQAKKKQQIRKTEKEIEKRRSQVRKLISQKMKIQGNNLQKFLSTREPISLETGPTYTSFSYYFSQAMSCLQSFDKDTGKQTEFETRAEYNMFEWKAMRSLYRENIKDIWSNSDKAPPKMKEYRAISLMQRKEEQFTDPDPSKKIKEQ